MAKSSRLKEMSDSKCEMEMTPMIDVTFQLLIFFMCTLKFKTLEGKLNAFLPKDVGVNQTQAEQKPKAEIALRVLTEGKKMKPGGKERWEGKGRFVYDSSRQVQYSIGPRKTTNLEEVERILREMHKQDPEMPATIDARPGIVYADVVKVLDIALDSDFQEITFVGAYDEKPKK